MKKVSTYSILKSVQAAIFVLAALLLSPVSVFAQNTCNAQFTFSPDSTVTNGVHFSTPPNPSKTKYYWNFGDGSPYSNDSNPTHSYANSGVYWVCVYVSDSAVCTAQHCDSVHLGRSIGTVCNAHFQFYSATNPDSVHFYSSTGTPTTKYSWTFGDGHGSSEANPWHFYANNGAYEVCLTVSDSNQFGKCTDTWCDSVHITGATKPTCNAQFVHYSGNNVDSVHFYPTGANATNAKYSWSFGDGTYSNLFNPWHIYATGNYLACLTVTDSTAGGKCTDTWCDSVHVGSNAGVCNAQFTFHSDSDVALYTVDFFNGTNPSKTKYYWSFDDGTTSLDQNPKHTYAHAGVYWVCLYVSDSAVCQSSSCDSVHVQGTIKPVCNAHFQDYTIADSVHFYASTASSTTTKYVWSFGDGHYSTEPNPWHLYPNYGTYHVCLTVTDSTAGGKCSDTQCDSVHIGPPPPPCNAHFTIIRPGANTNTVYFISPANPPGTNYSWDFGDNTGSQDSVVSHTYSHDGTYYVCLTVTNSRIPCSEKWCDSVTIKSLQKPVCNAHFVHYSINSNADSVHFYVTPPNASGTTYRWTFGDGHGSTNLDPWHFYANPGTYQVCLTVTDGTIGGTCSDSWCDSVHIIGAHAPTCNAHFQHYSLANADSVHYYSRTAASATTKYVWSFGDGSYSHDRYPWHFYADTGTYTVCLTVTDSTAGGKCSDTQCDTIHVGLPPPPPCNAHFTHISANATNTYIHFVPATNAPGTTYSWTFGDGGTSSNQDPSHLYANPGTYYACLTVRDSTCSGVCTNSWCDSVHVGITRIPCDAHFIFKYAYNVNTLYFVSNPNAPGTTYFWDFGDGSTSKDQNALHQFANPGTYWVCLTVADSAAACRATWCDSVHVASAPPPICDPNFYFRPGNALHSLYFFSVSNPPGTTYSWNFGDGSPASNTPNTFHQYAAAGTYKVCLTVADSAAGCSDTRCLTIGPLRMAEGGSTTDGHINSGDVIVNIYPNPIADNAVIHIENTSGAVTFSMFDNLGRLVSTMSNLTNGDFNLSKQGLGAGIYLYEIIDANNNVSRGKLIIQ